MSAENIEIVRIWMEAFNELDLEPIFATLDPEVELVEWPDAPGARTYHGETGTRQALDSWFEVWEWLHVDIDDVIDLDDRALVTLRQRAKGRGSAVEIESKTFNVYTFRNGKVRRVQFFTDRDAALEVAGLKEEEARQ